MLSLKEYQQRALDALHAYFGEYTRTNDADTAFYAATKKTLGIGNPYQAVRELPGLPYVCLRIPTGGGKTLVACHAVSIAARELLHADHPVVLWLVPSNAIREQTVKALRDRNHPYRQALDATCGSIEVMDIAESLYVTRATLDAQTTVIVSTMQAFRVDDTLGRKVYEDAGALAHHFSGVPSELLSRLQYNNNGIPMASLANVLCLRRPIVIVDEAHNARTNLSFETLARFSPSCIIEFTATPDREKNPSNILHSVSAAELRVEHMIKMPIRLETRLHWKELLGDAVACQRNLEALAHMERQQTGEYIRPIVLVQAQPHSKEHDTLSVEAVRECLLSDHRVPENQVAVAVGTKNEIEDIDLASQNCDIRFVITVQALREGWDCPFAYVLCTVNQQRSATYIEQIIGRVMRLPKACPKRHEELNVAYAFASSPDWAQVANMLADALVKVHGFERQEARDLILQVAPLQYDVEDVFSDPEAGMTLRLNERLDIDVLPSFARERADIEFLKTDSGEQEIHLAFRGKMTEEDRDELKDWVKTDESRARIERIFRQSNGFSLGGQNGVAPRAAFSVPGLAVRQGSFVELFEKTHFLEYAWDLRECDAVLTELEFSAATSKGQHGEITITQQGEVRAEFVSALQRQMELFISDADWTIGTLVHWLDSNIPHMDIPPVETGVFLTRAVQALMDQRGLSLRQLVHDKFRLRDALEAKIDSHRRAAHMRAFQLLILPKCATPLVVTPEICFTFQPGEYAPSRRYQGRFVFKKHFYDDIGNLNGEGEEFECAQFIDQLDEVETWVRNLEQRSTSFWLQTSTDKFYPDFVCRLKDGRTLVIEYKGGHLEDTADSREKQTLGELWEERSQGECIFLMVSRKQFDLIRQKVRSARPGIQS